MFISLIFEFLFLIDQTYSVYPQEIGGYPYITEIAVILTTLHLIILFFMFASREPRIF